MTTVDLDLFGNPVDDDPTPTTFPAAPATSATNDMDLIQSVLADVADEKSSPLHHDGVTVWRCGDVGPVADEIVAVVRQLVDARYLTTRRGCATPAHGPVVTTTPAGRGAVCRWRSYRRPPSWDVTTGHTTTEGNATR